MRKLVAGLALIAGVLNYSASGASTIWSRIDLQNAPSKEVQLVKPVRYQVFAMQERMLRLLLISLSGNPDEAELIELPAGDGTMRMFKVWQTPMLPAELAQQNPDISTFTAEAVDNHLVTAKLDFTMYGFHAMIYDGVNTSFIDPYDNYNDGYYLVHYKKDEVRNIESRMHCQQASGDENGPAGASMDIMQKALPKLAFRTSNGYQLRTYRLALGCSHQYAQAATGMASPTTAQTLSKMTTTMNRVNGIYEREFSVTMKFVANESSLIFTTASGDPYGPDDSNPGALLSDNQAKCDAAIGNANYDIGHVFSTGGGGIALLGGVCISGIKAQGVTGSSTPTGDGFDVDYVAHEMGHQFGSEHTFNNDNDGACGGNAVSSYAYEPGSGSTIMAYAGICSPDDLQFGSDAYFCASSLLQIHSCITTSGDACPVKTPTNNKFVRYASFTGNYSIPYKTPFELIAPVAYDSVADSVVLYCWEQYDLGDFGSSFSATLNNGPLFRSYSPSTSNVRIFPKNSMVLAGVLSNAGTNGAQGEKVPDVARTLKFKCTFRNIRNNKGCFTFPDDLTTLTAVNTGGGFKVTSQAATGISYTGHSTQTVTWNVVNTNVAPISSANVQIYMSVDGGNTWKYNVGTFPNTGSANITVPNPGTTATSVRFKVKGSGNVFFNVNSNNFTVTYNSAFPVSTGVSAVSAFSGDVKVFPVPASDMVHVNVGSHSNVQAIVINTMGQSVWQGTIDGQADISVAQWAKGVYHLRLIDTDNNAVIVKTFVVE
ncbi:MAG: T9SS type A sorting domain-containing protein [Taibaiella sp.]|nr:T9SS type A sorting domain-containing protein [Taibaiella sp.]